MKRRIIRAEAEAKEETSRISDNNETAAVPTFLDIMRSTVNRNSDILDKLGHMRKARSNGLKQLNRYLDKFNLS